ncbi:amidophosphoribosyltransferase [Cyanobium sp. WAJ14-Wanaka]|uniref:amidophosphoribosyltransferase n=1 Tax=Cyanobium sp. WAJ14-Wanaka TaxID=2823725 RepID=UPI0020CB7798|nr:amidophosphoribosyltransferase [Cyanobium sp. WAJ14-Wanaka]MCP9775552.1 amidophosphoribosyltransferase [Cyanobium sp. WAJ14-Wanaka]
MQNEIPYRFVQAPVVKERPDKPEEACGVYAVLASDQPVANLTYFGLYALQHRGQESAGIAVFDGEHKVRLHKDMGLVSQVFDQDMLERMQGQLAIGHNRYSTTGSSKVCNAQPVVLMTRLGPFALAHNGNLVNAPELRQKLADIANELTSTTDSELIAFCLQKAVNEGKDWDGALRSAAGCCRGAFSLVIGTPVGLFALRDGHGIRPLVFGHIGDIEKAQWVVSSESCGLDIIGAKFDGDVNPGEIIHFKPGNSQPQRSQWTSEPVKLCVFEMIYFARPDSRFFGESLYSYRVRIGETLARENPVEADIVIGVPDSGIPAAIGYSQFSGIPFGDGLIKNRYVGRTFIQPTQAMREAGIRVKLNPLPDVLSGKRVVVIDDSIVRGTTSRKLVAALRDAGATEVHMRISSPPVTHPCFYGIDTDTQDQLIAARLTLAEIAEHLGVDSLAYLSKSGMVDAAKDNSSHFCSACFDGAYPIEMEESVSSSKLMLEPAGIAATV